MASAISANRLELLQIAELVAREKSIDQNIVLEAMEEAIQKAARIKYGAENEIRAQIDKTNGDIRLFRVLEVVEEVEEPAVQISVADAQKDKPDAVVGDFLASSLPPMEFGRIAAQTAKQVIVQKVRDAERERHYNDYKDRVGEIVTGLVKRVEYGNVIVDLGRAEAVMRRDQVIPREHIRQNERIRGFIYDVRRENRGPQIFMSRTKTDFMGALFAQEVPEIYDRIIEIRSVARDPGSRAKIAVYSNEGSIDPVGACVGMRGSRVQAVVNELQGEKIDIIPWSPDVASFIVNALQPAEVTKVVMDEERSRVEVVVPDDQLSLAIGRRGQNVRLASQLTGWTIDIMTEAEESERRQEEFLSQSKAFVDGLDVDETLAHLLVAEGFTSLEEIAYVEPEELLAVEGFEEELVGELQKRANDHMQAAAVAADEKRKEIGVKDELAEVEGLTPQMLVALGEDEVKTLEDFAGCAADELTSKEDGILRAFPLTLDDASVMVMTARVALGWLTAEEAFGGSDTDKAAEGEEAEASAETEASAEGEETAAADAVEEAPAEEAPAEAAADESVAE
ncbi:MAG: transcription termination/antitermination protein NusA [Kordiimonadaceae bacterium]|nr:transcription termination/antitermination protein NusA [Kordiimonadaceae bacterium]